MTPRDSVQQGLDRLSTCLNPIIESRLASTLGGVPWTTILTELDRAKGYPPKIYAVTDLHCQLRMLTQRLGNLGYPFDDPNHTASIVAGELRIVRNRWAHYDEFTAMDAWRTHDFVARLLSNLGDAQDAAAAEAERNALLPEIAAETGHPIPAADTDPDDVTTFAPTPEPAPAADTSHSFEEFVTPDESVLTRGSSDDTPTIGAGREQYEPWRIVVIGDVSILDDLPKKVAKEKVRAVATEIVEFEGPIHRDRLIDLVAESFNLHRVHTARAKKIEYQIKQTELTMDADKFVWPADLDPKEWHEFRPNSSDANRPFTQISPVEIANAARFITSQAGEDALTPEELQSRVLQTFGRRRRTKQFVAHLEGALAAV